MKEASDELVVEGPSGGRYVIYMDGDTRLVAKPGNRKYSSYCENLRKTGEWRREGDRWVHSRGEAYIEIEEESGLYRVESNLEIDAPMYGFTSREAAEEFVEDAVEKNPEGLKVKND